MNEWLLRHKGFLLTSAAATFVLGIWAAILYPTVPGDLDFVREEGALIAPPSDELFADAWARPDAPQPVAAADAGGKVTSPGDDDGGAPGAEAPAPGPGKPKPGPTEPPPDDGFVPDLPILPPLLCDLPAVGCVEIGPMKARGRR